VSEPDPAMVDIIVASMGTGDSRALNVSPAGVFCAPAVCPIQRIAAHTKIAVNVTRFAVVFFNAQTLFLEIANFTSKFAQIIRGLTYEFKHSIPLRLKSRDRLRNDGRSSERGQKSEARTISGAAFASRSDLRGAPFYSMIKYRSKRITILCKVADHGARPPGKSKWKSPCRVFELNRRLESAKGFRKWQIASWI